MRLAIPVGWCVGTLKERNTDARSFKMMDGTREKVNFIIHYEIDDDEVKTVLRLEEYDLDDECGWVLLESAGAQRLRQGRWSRQRRRARRG